MGVRARVVLIATLFIALQQQVTADRLELVNHVDLWTGSPVRSSDASGLTYHPSSGHLLIADSEISEYGDATDADGERIFTGHNLFEVSLDLRTRVGAFLAAPGTGIAEFGANGTFVQSFDFSFLDGTGVTPLLTGGLTFAPSSDPNDHPGTHSIYISHRGTDNGAFPEKNTLDGAISEVRLVRERKPSSPIRVPADHSTIQGAIDAAADGDTIIVSPGLYQESLVLADKTIALVSKHFLTGRPDAIAETIIDGDGGDNVIKVTDTVGLETTISGFTIRNADDGITAYGSFRLTHCHITQTADGIDFERGGGLVRYCRFTHNRDDGIDLDGPTAATVEHCEIVDNNDDGIEIRLHPYTGETLRVHIRNNRIERNGEDGIQLIDYDTVSDRTFVIEGNVIADNAMVGIGCMGGSNTREDYSGAPIPEPIQVFNNTFADNGHHITGGANLLGVNNIFQGAAMLAIKRVAGKSRFHRNLFWRNTDHQQDSNVELKGMVQVDPLLDADRLLREGSPAIDAGIARVTWQGEALKVVHPAEIRGTAPDLGAFERAR
ncbi:MAG: right-handed parallel beta-helix repeat-containing protein [Candidatus Latescibacteria bacterium]|jgi:hypothetical protein|nr:right-handed parallel beta-helix repeat-containing protein [Candidatus Latescibacterota bacterium]